jgi:hypothetical protein
MSEETKNSRGLLWRVRHTDRVVSVLSTLGTSACARMSMGPTRALTLGDALRRRPIWPAPFHPKQLRYRPDRSHQAPGCSSIPPAADRTCQHHKTVCRAMVRQRPTLYQQCALPWSVFRLAVALDIRRDPAALKFSPSFLAGSSLGSSAPINRPPSTNTTIGSFMVYIAQLCEKTLEPSRPFPRQSACDCAATIFGSSLATPDPAANEARLSILTVRN